MSLADIKSASLADSVGQMSLADIKSAIEALLTLRAVLNNMNYSKP